MVKLFHSKCENIMIDIPEKSIDLILCDLPYGITNCKWDVKIPFDVLWQHYNRIKKINTPIVLFSNQPFTSGLINSNLKQFRYNWYWIKNYDTGFAFANNQPMRCVEDICVFYERAPVYNSIGVHKREEKRFRKRKVTEDSVYKGETLAKHYAQELSGYPNNLLYFELAILDPPWGKNAGCTRIKAFKKTMKIYDDIRPGVDYISEVFRVSKKQIIFSANLFKNVPLDTGGWIFWDKCCHYNIFSAGELIWVSFENKIRKYVFDMGYGRGFDYSDRIHPNQKPVEIYKMLLNDYAKKGDKILDTHLGSGSLAIACNEMGFELTGCEIDVDYFNNAILRIKQHANQGLFSFGD